MGPAPRKENLLGAEHELYIFGMKGGSVSPTLKWVMLTVVVTMVTKVATRDVNV